METMLVSKDINAGDEVQLSMSSQSSRVVMVVNKIKFYKIIIVLGAINYEGSKKKIFFFSQSVDRKCQSDDSAESLTGLSKRPS